MSRFRVKTAAHADDFAAGKVAWDVLKATAAHDQTTFDVLDLSDCVHVKPYSLACLASLALKRKLQGGSPTVVLPTDPRCREYVVDMGLERLISGESIEVSCRSQASRVVLQQLMKPDGAFASDAVTLLTDRKRLAGGDAPRVANHIDELVANALAHSGSEIGCIVAAQGYQDSVEVAVLDLGVTILGHLRKNPQHSGLRSDHEAILKSLEEGVTGTVGLNRFGVPNSGIGLFDLVQAANEARVEAAIMSGRSIVTIDTNGSKIKPFHDSFAGTLVCVRFLF